MKAKITAVSLVANGIKREFEFAHAERLLRMPNNGGWRLPENSKFEFVDYALQRRTDKEGDNGQ